MGSAADSHRDVASVVVALPFASGGGRRVRRISDNADDVGCGPTWHTYTDPRTETPFSGASTGHWRPGLRAIALSQRQTARLPSSKRASVVVTGNPVRSSIRARREVAYQSARGAERFRLLVIGGSQGASVFGQVVPKALALLPRELRRRLEVHQQCRAEDLAGVSASYEAHEIACILQTFLRRRR